MKKTAALLLSCLLIVTTACSHGTGTASSSGAPESSSVSTAESTGSQTETDSALPSGSSSAAVSSQTDSSETASSEDATVALTFPEGFTLAQIGKRLEANGVCKKADFLKMAQSYDFDYYPLVKAIPSSAKRAYKLEGYLYPDTYELYKNMKPQDVIGKFLRNAGQQIPGKYSYSGMTTDQLITLASIIEREADDAANMKTVSSVLHNRLKAGQRLEADATRDYCTQYLLAPNGPFADVYKYYYNTYRCAALPAGPICNPGSAALSAAANPSSTGYYYFITAKGKYYYQKTLAEHEAKLKELGMT